MVWVDFGLIWPYFCNNVAAVKRIRTFGLLFMYLSAATMLWKTGIHEWASHHEESVHCEATTEKHFHPGETHDCELCKLVPVSTGIVVSQQIESARFAFTYYQPNTAIPFIAGMFVTPPLRGPPAKMTV
jgi:hypothetical protein